MVVQHRDRTLSPGFLPILRAQIVNRPSGLYPHQTTRRRIRYRSNMTPHIAEESSTRLIDWSPFVIMGNTMPPRDPDEDDEDEDQEEEDSADEPPVVREPDED